MTIKKEKNNQVIIPILVCTISIIIGFLSKNTFAGMIILITGILNSYLNISSKSLNY